MRKSIGFLILFLLIPAVVFAVSGYPTKGNVINQQITKLSTYSFRVNLPSGISNLIIQSRQATDFTMAFVDTNYTPTPDTSAFYTVKSGTVLSVGTVSAQGMALYFKSTTTTPQDIEIQYWN